MSSSIATHKCLKSNTRVSQIQHAIPSDSTHMSALGTREFSDSGITSHILNYVCMILS